MLAPTRLTTTLVPSPFRAIAPEVDPALSKLLPPSPVRELGPSEPPAWLTTWLVPVSPAAPSATPAKRFGFRFQTPMVPLLLSERTAPP